MTLAEFIRYPLTHRVLTEQKIAEYERGLADLAERICIMADKDDSTARAFEILRARAETTACDFDTLKAEVAADQAPKAKARAARKAKSPSAHAAH